MHLSELNRAYNFSAGPSTLPLEVLQKAQQNFVNYQGQPYGIMEISHRSDIFATLLQGIQEKIRALLNIPDHYEVLLLQGGAQSQFSMIPINLKGQKNQADYIQTGIWSKKASEEGSKYINVNSVIAKELQQDLTIPASEHWSFSNEAAYLHYCDNETIIGLEFKSIPANPYRVPLICDMSSNILSKPIKIEDYGLIYACAQKNLGISGITLLILDKNLLGKAQSNTPSVFDYKLQIEHKSLYNTTATFAVYMLDLMLDWYIQQGGVSEMEQRSQQKSAQLYQYIDKTEFYVNAVDKNYRSCMNVSFKLINEDLNKLFNQQADQQGLLFLKGHRSYGGFRASIYNPMPMDAINKLIDFMKIFEKDYG